MRECASAQIQNLRMRITHRFSKFLELFGNFLGLSDDDDQTIPKKSKKSPQNSKKSEKMDLRMKKMMANEDFWTGKLGVVREPKICACARRTGFAAKPVVCIFLCTRDLSKKYYFSLSHIILFQALYFSY